MRKTFTHALRLCALGVCLATTALAAQARVNWSIGVDIGLPIYDHGYRGPGYGHGYGTVFGALPRGAVSVQIGGGRYWRHGGYWYRPWGPQWILVAPPVVLAPDQPHAYEAPPPPVQPPPPSRPDPVIYPRNNQSAEQAEFDRQACNRWATTQPAALADAAVFHRAVEACMDGRGYSMK